MLMRAEREWVGEVDNECDQERHKKGEERDDEKWVSINAKTREDCLLRLLLLGRLRRGRRVLVALLVDPARSTHRPGQ